MILRIFILFSIILVGCNGEATGLGDVSEAFFEIESVDGKSLPAVIATYYGEELCTESITNGMLNFDGTTYELAVGTRVDCAGKMFSADRDRNYGKYEQNGDRITFLPTHVESNSVSAATIVRNRITLTVTRASGEDIELTLEPFEQ